MKIQSRKKDNYIEKNKYNREERFDDFIREITEYGYTTNVSIETFTCREDCMLYCKNGHAKKYEPKSVIRRCKECRNYENHVEQYNKLLTKLSEYNYHTETTLEEYIQLEPKIVTVYCYREHPKRSRIGELDKILTSKCCKCMHIDSYERTKTKLEMMEYKLNTPFEKYDIIKVPVICKDGHNFTTTASAIKLGKTCPECASSGGEKACRFILESMCEKRFPKIKHKKIIRKVRALELDGYNEELKLAFEYNGEQHYMPAFGEKALEEMKLNDEFKAMRCKELGIFLVVVPYTVKSNEFKFFIHEKIQAWNPNVIKVQPEDIDMKQMIVTDSYTDRINEFTQANNLVWKAGVPFRADSELIFVCSNGHEFSKTATNILSTKTSCIFCYNGGTEEERLNRTEKKCPRCKIVKPSTEFSMNNANIDRKDCACKQCMCIVRNNGYKNRKERAGKTVIPVYVRRQITEKECFHCDTIRPIEEYEKDDNFFDGVKPYCNVCRPIFLTTFKTCFECGISKNLTEYNRKGGKRISTVCKECCKIQKKNKQALK